MMIKTGKLISPARTLRFDFDDFPKPKNRQRVHLKLGASFTAEIAENAEKSSFRSSLWALRSRW
jgi:hypothetical protein